MWILYAIAGFFAISAIVKLIERILRIQEHVSEKARLEQLDQTLSEREKRLIEEQTHFESLKGEALVAMERISVEKSIGFPWLATAYSEYRKLYEMKLARELEEKPRPAARSADILREMASEKAALRRENRILREVHRYYEALFPWLIDFKGEDLDEVIRQAQRVSESDDPEGDPADVWLSVGERDSSKLTRSEKFQRALDRWWQSKRPPWQIGRDYERYIGYLHDRQGFRVEYHGIEFGLDDLGRDLICKKGNEIRVIQCKNWSNQRTVHEKHVCQVFGTAKAYSLDQVPSGDPGNGMRVTAWLYTSCPLSETASRFARVLGVNVVQNFPMQRYPVIKCNISLRDGSKIYHLPFDQQYDRTLIEFKDECYVETIAEAESLGFRRAFRWRGQSVSGSQLG